MKNANKLFDSHVNKHHDIRKRRFRPIEFIVESIIMGVALFSLACIILIFVFVTREAFSIFYSGKSGEYAVVDAPETYGEEMLGQTMEEENNVKLEAFKEADESKSSFLDLFRTVWQPVSLQPKYGIWPLFAGSFKVALIALFFSAPIAVAAALFTSTFAPRWLKEIIKPAVEILAGFPSVVIGFVALTVIASEVQQLLGLHYRLNAFVGGIALCIAIIPIIFTISEDALNAVPRSYTEASLALGARKWQTALFVILPAAAPGVFAAILLGVGRAIGETMIVLMATGNAAFLSFNPFEPVRTMSATIGAEMAEVVFGEFHYSVLFFIGVILFAISFAINSTAEIFVRRLIMRPFK